MGIYFSVHVDDILVFFKSFEDHLVHLTNLFNKLREYKLTVKISKCEFAMKELVFVRHLIDNDGIRPDPKKTTVISKCAIPRNLGEVEQNGHPVYYYSPSLKKAEQKYGTSEKECLAMVLGIKKFRSYLYGNPFTVITDHSCLRYLFENRDHVGRLMRWSLMLQEYAADMTIQYKEGRLHSAPDACSRHPIARSEKLNAWM